MKCFVTEYMRPDGLYGDTVVALSWEDAQSMADTRARGEKVIGELHAIIPVSECPNPDEAVALMAERADSSVH